MNSIIWGNTATYGADIFNEGIYEDRYGAGSPIVNVSYSDIGVVYNNQYGTYNEGENVFNVDPLFADPENGSYRLKGDSKLIDVGTSDGAPSYDFDGTPRPAGNGVDIGAYEVPRYSLLVILEGSGNGNISSTDGGIDCGSDCQESYNSGLTVTLSASPNEGSFFAGWGGDCANCNSNASCPLVINREISCTATFNPILPTVYVLTVTMSGSGIVKSNPQGISCGNDCQESYIAGTTVTLLATESGSIFNSWSGDCSDCGSSKTCQVAMNSDKACTARFDEPPPVQRQLRVTKTGVGQGNVTSTPFGINCGNDCLEFFDEWTFLVPRAEPEDGSMFNSWKGGCTNCGSKERCQIVITEDTHCIAEFGKRAHDYFQDVKNDHWAVDALDAMFQKGVIKGYPDGTFRPEEYTTREEAAGFIVRASHGEEFRYPGSPAFIDVTPRDWSRRYVQKLWEMGVTKGCEPDDPGTEENEARFCPTDTITRAQIAVMLIRAKRLRPHGCSGRIFEDVNSPLMSEEFCSAIEELYTLGITKGCSERPLLYCPEDPVTRAQMSMFILRAFLGGE